MKLRRLLLPSLVLLGLLNACKKDQNEPITPIETINDLNVPEGFGWTTSREVKFSIAVHDTRYQNSLHVIEIFIGEPENGGLLLSKGAASLTTSFIVKAEVPATVNEVYVRKTAPDGSQLTQTVAVAELAVTLSIGSEAVSQPVSNKLDARKQALAAGAISATATSPDCTTGCSTTISRSTTVIIPLGTTYCITGSNITVTFLISPVNVRVCGQNVTINGLSSGANLAIATGASASLGNQVLSSDVSNFGTLNVDALTVTGSGELQNYGQLNAKTVYVTGTLTNSATLNVSGAELSVSSLGKITNIGTLSAPAATATIQNDFSNSGNVTVRNTTIDNGGVLTNTCNYNNTNTFNNESLVRNYSLIQVGNDTYLRGTLYLYNTAMFQTKYLRNLDGYMRGEGNTSLFKVVTSSDASILNLFRIVNAIQYCDPSRRLTALQFLGGASQGCDLYVAKSDCNPIGNGTAPLKDSDNDGIVDDLDDYPNDATRAFNTYSVNYQAGGSTVAFEDSWPLMGDYDLNDIVLSHRYQIVTNATNRVVEIKADYKLMATGGEFQNGAGIQFNLPAGSATAFKGTSGTEIESGQDSVVVVLFKNSRNEQSSWNTLPGLPQSEPKTYSISFNVTNGPTLETFGIGTYNPFIWNNSPGFGRGYETHLFGKQPTKLANQQLFGTGDDISAVDKYYRTKTLLPWGINLPITPFSYPNERVSITNTYLKFAGWATSGGTTNLDWYSNTTAGYRNNSNIYTK